MFDPDMKFWRRSRTEVQADGINETKMGEAKLADEDLEWYTVMQ